MIIIKNPHLYTNFDLWYPRYKDKTADKKEYVVLIPVYKIQQATPTFLVHFSKAKHLEGLRYAISRQQALEYPTQTVKSKQGNDVLMFVIPLPHFDNWVTPGEEFKARVMDIFFNPDGTYKETKRTKDEQLKLL